MSDLRPATQASYRNSIETHLRPRWGRRRMDSITADDAAKLVRELRAQGLAETSIATVLRAGVRTFKFARRRLGWHGTDPISDLDNGERPKLSQTKPRRIFTAEELAQTLTTAPTPWRELFSLAAITGARESELLGLTWADVDLSDPTAASVTISEQLGRNGERVELKTDESRRTVEIPWQLAAMLRELKASSAHSGQGSFVFATRTGRATNQRNAIRALRRIMEQARGDDGKPAFPELFQRDERGHLLVDGNGRYVLRLRTEVERGTVPTFHGFRHTAASEAIAAGDVEEVSWQLGHKNSVITRTVYRHEIKSAERTAQRRAKMEARYGSLLGSSVEAAQGTSRSSLTASPRPKWSVCRRFGRKRSRPHRPADFL